jgi:hypothetical protein
MCEHPKWPAPPPTVVPLPLSLRTRRESPPPRARRKTEALLPASGAPRMTVARRRPTFQPAAAVPQAFPVPCRSSGPRKSGLAVECRPIGRFSPSEGGQHQGRTHAFVLLTMRAQNSEVAISILRSAALVRADDPRRRLLAGPNKSLHGAPSLRSQSHPRVVRDRSAFKTCHSRPGHLDNRRSLPPIVGLKPYYPRGSHVFRAGVGPHRFPNAPGHGFTLARRRPPTP